MRDVVCLNIEAMASRLSNLHDATKAMNNRDKEQQKKNQEQWRRVQKAWAEDLAQVRSRYHQLPRGRRPKGWIPPSDEPEWTLEEADRAYAQGTG